MESDADACPRCGLTLRVGDYPFCPHGTFRGAVRPDDVPGGFVVENGFSEPRKFYSKQAHREALAANGNMLCDWNRGEHDRVCPRWDSVDLESATALVSRGQKAYKDDVPSAPPALVQALKDQLYR